MKGRKRRGRAGCDYRFGGPLHYTISGTDPEGCTLTGEGSFNVASKDNLGDNLGKGGGLTVDYLKEQYWGVESLIGAEWPYVGTCEGVSSTIDGPLSFSGAFFSIEPVNAQPMESTTAIAGSVSEPSFGGLPPSNYSWDLTASPG